MQNIDLTAQWTKFVSKYKIEQLFVYLTCENFKYNIKLHCTQIRYSCEICLINMVTFKYTISFIGRS